MSAESLTVAQSQSGKWHLLGPRGCLSVVADRLKAESVETIRDDKRRRDWCSYCEQELRILDLEREVERLEAAIDREAES